MVRWESATRCYAPPVFAFHGRSSYYGPKGKRRRVSSYFCRLLDALMHVLNRAWISTSRTKSGVLQQFSDLPVPGHFNRSLPVFILGVWVSPVG